MHSVQISVWLSIVLVAGRSLFTLSENVQPQPPQHHQQQPHQQQYTQPNQQQTHPQQQPQPQSHQQQDSQPSHQQPPHQQQQHPQHDQQQQPSQRPPNHNTPVLPIVSSSGDRAPVVSSAQSSSSSPPNDVRNQSQQHPSIAPVIYQTPLPVHQHQQQPQYQQLHQPNQFQEQAHPQNQQQHYEPQQHFQPQQHYPPVGQHQVPMPVMPLEDPRGAGRVPLPNVGSASMPYAPLPPHPPPPPVPLLRIPPHVALYYAPSAAGDFGPDSDIEVQHEFKIAVAPSREECLFQKSKPQSRFYFSFKVLGGADHIVDVVIRSPDGSIVDQHLFSKEGTSDKFMSFGEGPFSVCIANVHSRFSAMLIHVFIATYVVEEWHQYDNELRQVDGSLGNSTVSLHKVAKAVSEMRLRQSWSRQQSSGDFYIIRANNDGIQFWSIVMCALIVICSLAQVTFVHRLFTDRKPSSTSGYKQLRA